MKKEKRVDKPTTLPEVSRYLIDRAAQGDATSLLYTLASLYRRCESDADRIGVLMKAIDAYEAQCQELVKIATDALANRPTQSFILTPEQAERLQK